MKLKSVTLPLTEDQRAALEPLMLRMVEMAARGQPGMLLAQVHGKTLQAVALPAELAVQVQRALGTEQGLTSAEVRTRHLTPTATSERKH